MFVPLFISEINILWAAHQVHHSSEEYNLTTALRQSIMQSFGSYVSIRIESPDRTFEPYRNCRATFLI